MNDKAIIHHRLFNQQIGASNCRHPKEVVRWMVAMQAQEFAMAKWSIGLRLPGSTDLMIEEAFNKGEILRTHLMRPTWHFLTPEDIRWLIQLTAPRVNAFNAFTYRQQELDSKIFKRSHHIIEKALEGGKHLLRTELQAKLQHKKIKADGIRLSALMMEAELAGVICSGPRRGNQFTYALLEERVPQVKKLTKQEALIAFTDRYFRSRGPASLKDFTTWSGLTVAEAKEGINNLGADFVREKINDQDYYFVPLISTSKKMQANFLMPDYDEYGMSYKDRSAILNTRIDLSQFKNDNPIFNRMIILNGKIHGTWKRVIQDKKVKVEAFPFETLSKVMQTNLAAAIEKYRSFVRNEA